MPGERLSALTPGAGKIPAGDAVVRLFESEGWVWQNVKVPDYMHLLVRTGGVVHQAILFIPGDGAEHVRPHAQTRRFAPRPGRRARRLLTCALACEDLRRDGHA
jgi:hypothetical protein